MFRLLRRARRDERGQAMIIGAIAMLILALMVMASVTIGHGVYSKIKLQDAADAQSYSIAVKEARAYNFLAYTNRAMVVHYSAMLTLMSYVSHALYLEKTVGTAAKYLKYIPVIGAIFAAVEQAIKAWMKIVDAIAQVAIPILTYINIGLWIAQEALIYATVLDLQTSSASKPLKETDPKANQGYVMRQGSIFSLLAELISWDMNAHNAKNFLNVLDDGPSSSSNASPLDGTGMAERKKLLDSGNSLKNPNMAKYRLLMGNIANGVRKEWTARGKGPMLIGRRWNIDICLGVGITINKVADSQIKSFAESGSENRKDELFASDDISMRVNAPCLGPLRKTIFKFDYRIRVAANNADGFHQATLGGRTGSKSDKHHSWRGITPFLMADPSYWSPWSYHFGYPCNMVFASKDMVGKSQVFQLKTRFMAGKGSGKIENDGELDMTWNEVGDAYYSEMMGGMTAISVGRAIYHRPGDWKEEPNFFNPLWTARLAPINTHWEKAAMEMTVRDVDGTAPLMPSMLNY